MLMAGQNMTLYFMYKRVYFALSACQAVLKEPNDAPTRLCKYGYRKRWLPWHNIFILFFAKNKSTKQTNKPASTQTHSPTIRHKVASVLRGRRRRVCGLLVYSLSHDFALKLLTKCLTGQQHDFWVRIFNEFPRVCVCGIWVLIKSSKGHRHWRSLNI